MKLADAQAVTHSSSVLHCCMLELYHCGDTGTAFQERNCHADSCIAMHACCIAAELHSTVLGLVVQLATHQRSARQDHIEYDIRNQAVL